MGWQVINAMPEASSIDTDRGNRRLALRLDQMRLVSARRLLSWYAPTPTDASEFFCYRASKIDAGNVTSGGMAESSESKRVQAAG
jgi:hypothetical protein